MRKIFLRRLKFLILRIYTRVYGRLHKIEKKILFISFGGSQYSDNPRAVCEKMHELFPDYELMWRLKDNADQYGIVPDYVKTVPNRSLSFYRELATACCFVTNNGMEPNIAKRRNQYFVQTWHGDRAFKKVLYDVWDDRNEKRPLPIIDNKLTDVCVAASDFGVRTYHSAFRYSGEILCVGSPRNDQLINEPVGKSEDIKGKLKIGEENKVLLYAPTFREGGGGKKQEIPLDLNRVIKCLESKGEEWICLLRAHVISGGIDASEGYDEHFMDVTDYPDMSDLLLITDLLITDYSSSSGDLVLRGKPIILFVPDLDEYQDQYRTLRVQPEETGFLTAESTEDVIRILEKTTMEEYEESCKKVMDFYRIVETGESSRVVCEKINEHWRHNL